MRRGSPSVNPTFQAIAEDEDEIPRSVAKRQGTLESPKFYKRRGSHPTNPTFQAISEEEDEIPRSVARRRRTLEFPIPSPLIEDKLDADTTRRMDDDTFPTPTSRPTSIDDFFEKAYNDNSNSFQSKWKYWLMFFALGTANIGDASEYASLGYLLANESFQNDMLHDVMSTDGSILASIALFGLIIGGLFTGAYEDKLGRKPALLMGLSLNFIGGAFSVFAPNVAVLATLRFLAGLGIGAILSSLVALASELSPASKRGFFVGFVGSFWTVGSISIALLAMVLLGKFQLSWRVFLAFCSVPAAVCFILVALLIPESPRFLLVHGKHTEGIRNANRVAAAMGYMGPMLTMKDLQLQPQNSPPSRSAVPSGSDLHATSPLEEANSTKEALANILALYSNPRLRKNTIALQILWACISSGSIGLWITTIYEEVGLTNMYFGSLLFAAAAIPGNVVCALLIDRMGRKPVFSLSMSLAAMTLAYFAWISAGDVSSSAFQVIATSCLYTALTSSAWTSLSVMAGELFPTKVRSTGIGICATAGRLSNIMVQFIYGQLISTPHLLLLVACAFVATGAITAVCTGMDEMSKAHLVDNVEDKHKEGTAFPHYPKFDSLGTIDTYCTDMSEQDEKKLDSEQFVEETTERDNNVSSVELVEMKPSFNELV